MCMYVYVCHRTGNLSTLRDTPEQKGLDVRAELLKFHQQYYSANCMKACVSLTPTLIKMILAQE